MVGTDIALKWHKHHIKPDINVYITYKAEQLTYRWTAAHTDGCTQKTAVGVKQKIEGFIFIFL